MHHDPSDLGSQILIRILPKERNQRYFPWRDVAPDVRDSVFEFENTNERTYIYAKGQLKIVSEPVVLTDVKILEL